MPNTPSNASEPFHQAGVAYATAASIEIAPASPAEEESAFGAADPLFESLTSHPAIDQQIDTLASSQLTVGVVVLEQILSGLMFTSEGDPEAAEEEPSAGSHADSSASTPPVAPPGESDAPTSSNSVDDGIPDPGAGAPSSGPEDTDMNGPFFGSASDPEDAGAGDTNPPDDPPPPDPDPISMGEFDITGISAYGGSAIINGGLQFQADVAPVDVAFVTYVWTLNDDNGDPVGSPDPDNSSIYYNFP